MSAGVSPAEVIAFWRDAGPAKWYAKDPAFDAAIAARFGEAHHQAARGELAVWEADSEGALALLLLLDQFPRNMFRGSAHSFATDPLARRITHKALDAGLDRQCGADLRVFFYLPLEHSEALADQNRCVELCDALDATSGSEWARWARLHRDIIVRFGRFPHRNAALGRQTTAEEQAFLEEGGFSG
ncbi:MAG: DUF924 family protein [Sphingomonadales bacterium]|nr:DUF924 family protein [Sphingomonadaceae bacterium]MBS3931544.1 DUF924 family protein [Sphingomonadales bacterium]